jgi:hypothetical protein
MHHNPSTSDQPRRWRTGTTPELVPHRLRLAALLALVTAALAACGGGIVISLGGGYDDYPPDVSLVVNVSEAFAGDVLHLSAAASDDYGVDTVEFYRVEPGGNRTLLGTDGRAPWALDTLMPDVIASNGSTIVRYLARATDGASQHTDSTIITVQQLR